MSEVIARLGADTADWSSGFSDATQILDEFESAATAGLANVATACETIAPASRNVGIGLTAVAYSAIAVGKSSSMLFSVASALTGIGAATYLAKTGFAGLKSGTSIFEKLTASVALVGSAAVVSSLGLRAMSFGMARFGKDTAQVDALAKTLRRVGLAATVTVLSVKAVGFAFGTMRATAGLAIGAVTGSLSLMKSTILALPSAIGAVAGGLSRLGSASVGILRSGSSAVGQFAANAGEGLGKIGQGVASVATGFAVGGIVGGLATIAGLAVASGLSFDMLGKTANEALEKMQKSLSGVWDWLKELGSGLAATGLAMINTAAQKGQEYFDAFLLAIFPLTDAIKNVWLPAVTDSTSGVQSAFSGLFEWIETNWGAWIFDSIESLAEFIGNFDIYFQIAQQSIALWASNSILQVQDFFANFGTWLNWFGENWADVLFSAFDLAATVFINIGQNIRDIFSSIWEWVSSGFTNDLVIDWTPLTDGFVSTIKKFPDLVKTELATTSPELEDLYSSLGERQAAAAARAAIGKPGKDPVPMEDDEKAKAKKYRGTAFAAAGSSEAYSTIVRAMSQRKDPVEKNTATMVKTLTSIDKNIDSIAKKPESGLTLTSLGAV